MIVRLLNEGQYRIGDELKARLNELDDEAVAALEGGDEAALAGYLEQMAALASLISYGLEGVLTGIGFCRRTGVRPGKLLLPLLEEVAEQLRSAGRQVLWQRSES